MWINAYMKEFASSESKVNFCFGRVSFPSMSNKESQMLIPFGKGEEKAGLVPINLLKRSKFFI